MNEEQIIAMVDDGCTIDAQIKALEVQKKKITVALKEFAAESECNLLCGTGGNKAVISAYSRTTVLPLEFVTLCEETKIPMNVMIGALSVSVVEGRKIIGEYQMDSISDTQVNPYGRIAFKSKK